MVEKSDMYLVGLLGGVPQWEKREMGKEAVFETDQKPPLYRSKKSY